MNGEGLIIGRSDWSFAETVGQLDAALAARRITAMARIDHAELARAAGLSMAPTIVLIFGNPVVGTALMQAAPTMGLDLPLKMLVWETGPEVWLAYRDPRHVAEVHGLDPDRPELAVMSTLLADLAAAASGRQAP